MDWNLVRLFVEVVDAGSMSEAARRRGITRSSISQRLAQLEQQVGAQLLRRTTRQLKVTEIGRTLYEHGRQVSWQFETARHDIETLGKTLSGLVRVSVPPTVGQTYIAPALAAFAQEHPTLTLNVAFNNRLTDLIDADVDIALRILPRAPDDMVARELSTVHWRFFCTRAYIDRFGPLDSIEDLARADFLTTTGSRRIEMPLISSKERVKVTLNPRISSENAAFIRDCMQRDYGVAMLPNFMTRDLVAGGTVVPVLPQYRCPDYDSKFFILTVSDRFPTPAMSAVIDLLREAVAEVMGGDEDV
jgi:DNA-binding transcriptional LysR family regulator